MISIFLIAMIVGNGLYCFVRDYYLKQGSQKFVNVFGLIFEDYIKDLATNCFESFKWNILSAGAKKGADFVFVFGSLQMLIESKSSLLKLDAKQQVHLDEEMDYFSKVMKYFGDNLQ